MSGDRVLLPKMQEEAVALADAHHKAVAFIEEHLFEPMTVESIAESSGFSPSRFSRGFTRLQGESVMAYLRGRRLEASMRRILSEPGVRVIDLAFDCGFDSQEAFTRAFLRTFGQTPGRFRRSGASDPLLRRRKPLKERPQLSESVARHPEFHRAGLEQHFSPANFGDMSALWRAMAALTGFRGQLGEETYGVRCKRYRKDGSFDFFAGLRIAAGCEPPSPLKILILSPHNYLVFRHLLHEGDLYPQMIAANEVIWSQRIPQSGHALADAPDFHLYPAPFKVKDGWIDHYFPIQD